MRDVGGAVHAPACGLPRRAPGRARRDNGDPTVDCQRLGTLWQFDTLGGRGGAWNERRRAPEPCVLQ